MNWNPIGQYRGGARILDPNWIDTGHIKTWITECDQEHENCWRRSFHIAQPVDIFVIDVVNLCISRYHQGLKYLALSYVWGEAKNFELRRDNVRELFKEGSLRSYWKVVPRTIKDAIMVTEKLGFQYIWVDSLCIIQDDDENKSSQISQMASVYGSAAFTIVAADSDSAEYGLRGTGESPRSSPVQQLLELAPGCTFVMHREMTISTTHKVYFTRGWTFQEFQLARRLLVFIDGMILWKCSEHERNEELLDSAGMYGRLKRREIGNVFTWPDFRLYTDLVKDYNSRNLRNDADALSAFTGLLVAINRQFLSGFLQGLPELYFDNALLWQPANVLRRRLGSDEGPEFASWSWLGWQGDLDFSLCNHGIEDPRVEEEFHYPNEGQGRVFPITAWYKSTSEWNRPSCINNEYYCYRSLCFSSFGEQEHEAPRWEDEEARREDDDLRSGNSHQGGHELLTTGWYLSACLHRAKDMHQQTHLAREKKICWRHNTTNEAFAFPLPLGQGPTVLQNPKLRYLHFQSGRCFLYTTNKDTVVERRRRRSCLDVDLEDENGLVVGVLRLNHSARPQSDRESCELIAISRGMANVREYLSQESFPECKAWDHLMQIIKFRAGVYPQFMQAPLSPGRSTVGGQNGMSEEDIQQSKMESMQNYIGMYKFYNVLCVEWKDGIAYRKALGRVGGAWEAQELERINVVLG
jgi:hypothetical protein